MASRDRSSSSTSSSDSRPRHSEILSRSGRDAGISYLSPTNAPLPVLTESYRTSPEKFRKSHRSRSDRRHNDGSGTRELVQMLLSEERDAKDALRALNKTADRLTEETRRAEEAERKLVQSHERFKMVNQARQTALQDVTRLQEELRLYKLQLETAQTQITRANELIAQSDRERHAAEEAAEKARDTARKYHEERLVRDAREEGRKQGRDEGREEGRTLGYNQALEEAYSRARRDAFARLDDYLTSQGMEMPNEPEEDDALGDALDDALDDAPVGYRRAGSTRAGSDAPDDVLSEFDIQNPPRPIQMPVPVTDRRTNPNPPVRPPTGTVQPPRRRNTFLNRLRRRAGNAIDPNVEINEGAPDLGTIVESGPIIPVTTPLPNSATTQLSRANAVSPGPMRMPEPEYNPDPSTVHPIPVRNRSPSIRHSAYDIPPDGFIPTISSDGNIGLPPPHELSRQPSLSGSPGGEFGGVPLPPPKSPIVRDFAAEERERRARSRSPGPSLRDGMTTPVYQSANISGGFGFDGRSTPGRTRTPVPDNDLRRMSSYSSVHSRPRSPVGPRNPQYADPMSMPRNPQYADPMSMPMHETQAPMFSPRSNRSFTPGPGPPGPRRPTQLTMPAPLAEASAAPQAYTRPRINSIGSDMLSDRFSARSPGFGGDPRRPSMHRRGESVASSGVPDITIEPPSRPPSNTTTKTPGTLYNNYSPLGSAEDPTGSGFAPPMPPYVVPPPGAVSPGPPIQVGGIGGSPRVADNELPLGFMPTSPAMPTNMPVPNLPSGPLPFRAPSPRVRTSIFDDPAAVDEAGALPPGFIPTSPSVPSAHVTMPVPTVDGRVIAEEESLSMAMPVPTVHGRAITSGEGNSAQVTMPVPTVDGTPLPTGNAEGVTMPVPTVGGTPLPTGNAEGITMPVPVVGGVPLPTMNSALVTMPMPNVQGRPISGEGFPLTMPMPTVGGFPLAGRGPSLPSDDGRRTPTPRDPQPGSNRWSGGSYARASPGMGFSGGLNSVNILQQTPSASAMPLGPGSRSPRPQGPILPTRIHELRNSASDSLSPSGSSKSFEPVIPSRPTSTGPAFIANQSLASGSIDSSVLRWPAFPEAHISPVPSPMPVPFVNPTFDTVDALPVLPGGMQDVNRPRSPRPFMPSPRQGHAPFPSMDGSRPRSPRPQSGSTPFAGMGNPLPSMGEFSRPRSPMPPQPVPLSRPGQDSIFGPGIIYDNAPVIPDTQNNYAVVIPVPDTGHSQFSNFPGDDNVGRRTPRAGDYGHRRRGSEASSMNTFTTSPGRRNSTALPVYPNPSSPAFTTMTAGSAIRRVALPSSRPNTPGASSSYLVTPLRNLSAGMSEDFIMPPPLHSAENFAVPVISPSSPQLERPVHGFTNRAPSLHRSESKISVSSNRSHRHYDASQDLDPAFLIGRSDNREENHSPERTGSRASNKSRESNQSAGALWEWN